MKGKYGGRFLQAYDCIACHNLVFWLSTVTSHNSFISVLQDFKMLSQVGQKWIETSQHGDSPISQQKKKTERDLWLTKSQIGWWSFVNRNTSSTATNCTVFVFQRARLHCAALSVYPLYIPRFQVFPSLQRHLQIENLNFLHLSQQHCSFQYVKSNKIQWNTSYSFQPLTP